MSLILDALRKMEQERKSRRSAAQSIRSEVLRYRSAVKEPQARPYLLVAGGVLLLAIGLGAGFMLNGNRRGAVAVEHGNAPERVASVAPSTPSAPPQAAPPSSPSLPAGVPAQKQSAPTPSEAAAVTPAAKAAVKRAVAVPVAGDSAAEAPASFVKVGSVETKQKLTIGKHKLVTTGIAKPKTSRREMVDNAPVATDITVSGIAWQDERSLRRAVVNGTLVGEGAEVAGARVIEIKEDKVRISRGGRTFDVVYSSGISAR